MHGKHIYAIVIGILVLILSGCGQSNAGDDNAANPLVVGTVVQLTGTVVGTIDDCAADGICAYVIDTDQGQYNAIWAEGMIPCEGQLADNIGVGDTIEANGQATNADSVSICAAPEYFIRTT